MNPSERHLSTILRLLLVAVTALVMACAGNRPPEPPVERNVLRFLAVSDDRLLLITPPSSEPRLLATSPLLQDVSALAFNASSDTAYAIADASTAPLLLQIDLRSAGVKALGRIELPPTSTRTADAMVFDPAGQRLLIAAGSRGLSNELLAVDPGSLAVTRLGRVRNTPQGEVDGLALARGVFYAIDHVSDQTYFFELRPGGPEFSALGRLPGKITDLAGDPGSGRLFAVVDGRLAVLHLSAEPSMAPFLDLTGLTALAVIDAGPELFADGFEGGDLAGWSGGNPQ